MSRQSMLPSQLGCYTPFPGLDFGDEALASEYGRLAGGAEADPRSVLPYRRHSMHHRSAATAPTRAADLPAMRANHHPAIASGALAVAGTYKTHRSSAALAAARSLSFPTTVHPHPAAIAYQAAHLQDLQRRDIARKRRLRDLQERQAERARKFSRPRPAARPFIGMADNAAGSFGPSEEELAEMQRLSRDYVPDVEVSLTPPSPGHDVADIGEGTARQ